MAIDSIDYDEFKKGKARAEKTLTPSSARGGLGTFDFFDLYEPFTEQDVQHILDLHDYAQWHELEGAPLMQAVRMLQPLTLEDL